MRDSLSLEPSFTRLYQRSGGSYLTVFAGATTAVLVIIVVPLYSLILIPFLDTSLGQVARIILAFQLAVVAGCGLLSVLILRTAAGPVVEWTRGVRSPEAATDVWSRLIAGFPKLIVATVSAIALCCLPPAIYAAGLVDLSFLGALLYIAWLSLLIVGAGVIAYLVGEQATLPIVREAAAMLPIGTAGPVEGISLRTKLLVLVPTINLYTGTIVGAVSTNSLGLEGRLALTAGVAIVVTLTIALGLAVMFRGSLVRRLDDLRHAMQSIREGDYETRVLPLAGDELDELGQSFNQMVGRIANHDDEMRESRARIVAAADDARRQVERDLHDGAQQQLVALGLRLSLAEEALQGHAEGQALVKDARGQLSDALAELRNLAHGIYPMVLETGGLPRALAQAAERAAIETSCGCELTTRPSREIEAAVYFCCMEALQNAAKHAGPGAKARIEIRESNRHLRFSVSDDGAGFNPVTATANAGLQNLNDRVGALGGDMEVTSTPGHGTAVAGSIPLAL